MKVFPKISSLLKIPLLLLLLFICLILFSEIMVESYSSNKVYNSTKEIPANNVGLLLGTSKRLKNGNPNLYYKYRIQAAIKLYNSKKVNYILVSGDNGSIYYDEPTTIKKDLIAGGIPEESIFLDYAGFRTYDSVIRCKEVFQQDKFTVISQQFHNERAIFIASMKGIEAVGFNAKDVGHKWGMGVKIRERFARVKMMLDFLVGKEPKFLGEKIFIE